MEEQLLYPVKVILVDDNKRIRSLVREVLQMENNVEVCDEAGSLKDMMPLIEKRQPDVLIIDVMHQECGGEDAFFKIISQLNASGMKIIILSAHAESHYSDKCLAAGASGYVSKDKIISCLAPAIRNVHAGQKFVSSMPC